MKTHNGTNVCVLGVILNDVELSEKKYGYYYSRYYRYGSYYGQYYGGYGQYGEDDPSDEDTEPTDKASA